MAKRAKITSPDAIGDFGAMVWEDMKWIYLNLGNVGVSDDDAPNAGALATLRDIQENPTLRERFMLEVFKSAKPEKDEKARVQRYQDDGRASLSLLEKFIKPSQP